MAFLFSVFGPILGARTQGAQVMPVIDAVIVAVLPDNGQRIGADGFEVVEARGG